MKKLKKLTIELVPFCISLHVYFEKDKSVVEKQYKNFSIHENMDGCNARVEHLDGKVYEVIFVQNDDEWKKSGWIAKTCLIAHEVSHCIDDIMEYWGVKDDEFRANYMQWLLAEILTKYDFKKNCLK